LLVDFQIIEETIEEMAQQDEERKRKLDEQEK
jgi:hypothetical protein